VQGASGESAVSGEASGATRSKVLTIAIVSLGVLVVLVCLACVQSRIARGSWNVVGTADRINLPNGRRYYLEALPPSSSPDLRGFESTGTPVWPDSVWYVERGPYPVTVWARTFSGSYWRYGISGGW
jgi:hypothetical protein